MSDRVWSSEEDGMNRVEIRRHKPLQIRLDENMSRVI